METEPRLTRPLAKAETGESRSREAAGAHAPKSKEEKTMTTAQKDAMRLVRKIQKAIAEAEKAHEVAQTVYAQMRTVCGETEEAEKAAESKEHMASYWQRESEAFKAADAAAKAAMIAGKNVAQFADHPACGTDAMKAAESAFSAALEWMA